MTAIPRQLRDAFSDAERSAIDRWWSGLTDEGRGDVSRLCDERLDECFFGVVVGERVLPKVRGGKFLAGDDAWGFEEWGPEYFEHLIQHSELVVVWDPTERTFHTGCTRHPIAQACWKIGWVPDDLACPFGDAACWMKPLLGRRLTRRCLSGPETL